MITFGIGLWPHMLLVLSILGLFAVTIQPLGPFGSYSRARGRWFKLWAAYSLSVLLTLWALLSLRDANPLATSMGAAVIWGALGAVRGSRRDIRIDFETAQRYSRNKLSNKEKALRKLRDWRNQIISLWENVKLRIQREHLHWLEQEESKLHDRLMSLESAKTAARQKIAAQTGDTLMMPAASAPSLAVGEVATVNAESASSG
jgi:hypothetical protein